MITSKEFFNKYWIVKNGKKLGEPIILRDVDNVYFDMWDKASKENKEVMLLKGRTRL